MNKQRRQKIDILLSVLDESKGKITTILEEEQEAKEGIPESMEEKIYDAEECLDYLQEVIDGLSEVMDNLLSAKEV